MKYSRMIAAAVVLCPVLARATEYIVPAKVDVGTWFAQLPKDATSVVFSATDRYHSSGDITLPAQAMLVIDGRGCKLALGPGSNGFTNQVASMDDAMRVVNNRYVIK
ncbi:MAG: hypothetical protein JSU02_12180, partial [Bacteroidetes bacterium]|nr:hypothetical protein [Bacteroidota bacterium]